MDRRVTPRAKLGITTALLTLVLSPNLVVPAAADSFRRGEYITIRGHVTSLDGAPLAGVTVLLEPSRRAFRLSKMFQPKHRREQTDRLQIPTVSGGDGVYSFEWRWDPYYNTFELAIAVPRESGDQKSYEVLHRTDFTDRMMDGSPVEVTLEVEDPSRLSATRPWSPTTGGAPPPPSFEAPRPPAGTSGSAAITDTADAEAKSSDERRILDEMGSPDQIDSHQRLAGLETSWWYFEEGKVYHFLNSELSQVMHFDPIPSPDG